ncbi:MAG: hypothetical protein AB9856_02760 [Cellulosilyticaceae bacterium]
MENEKTIYKNNSSKRIYNCIIIGIIIFYVLSNKIKEYIGFSFIEDKINIYLWEIFLLMILLYPFCKNGILIAIRIIIVIFVGFYMFYLSVLGSFSTGIYDTNYEYIKSPNKNNEIILKQYVTGLHHLTENIELYKRIGIFFKKDLEVKICISEDEVGNDGTVETVDQSKLSGKKICRGGNHLLFEWMDDEIVNVYCITPLKHNGGKEIERTIDLSEN